MTDLLTTAEAFAALRYRAALADKRGDTGEARDLRAVERELARLSQALRDAQRCEHDRECVLSRGHEGDCDVQPYFDDRPVSRESDRA